MSHIRYKLRGGWEIRNLKEAEAAELERIQTAVTKYLAIYVTFELLEDRIQGIFPACEGILIVKERK